MGWIIRAQYLRLAGGGGGVLFERQSEGFRSSIVGLRHIHDGGARLRVPRRVRN